MCTSGLECALEVPLGGGGVWAHHSSQEGGRHLPFLPTGSRMPTSGQGIRFFHVHLLNVCFARAVLGGWWMWESPPVETERKLEGDREPGMGVPGGASAPMEGREEGW